MNVSTHSLNIQQMSCNNSSQAQCISCAASSAAACRFTQTARDGHNFKSVKSKGQYKYVRENIQVNPAK